MLDRILAFDINIFAVFLLATMLVIVRVKGDRHSHSSGLFRIIIVLTMIALILEPVTWIADEYGDPFARFVGIFSNGLLVLVGPVLIGFWVAYVDYIILHDRARLRRLHYYQWATYLTLLLLGLNAFVPVYFTITRPNDYYPGPLSWLNTVLMLLGVGYSAYLTVRYRDRTGIGLIRGVMAFFILPVIGSLIQMIDIHFLFTWPMLALAIVVVYLFLETTSGTLDRLTGLYSRAKFDQYARYIKEKGELFGFLMIDLDDFKAVNDNFGHQAGDVVLAEFAAILKEAFHAEKMVARIGGDEFMVVTVHDADAAARSVAAVRDAVAHSTRMPALRSLRFSYGFIQNEPDRTVDELLSEVDHRMYRDKAKNKNLPNNC